MHMNRTLGCVCVYWINDEKRVETKKTKQSAQNDKYKREVRKNAGLFMQNSIGTKGIYDIFTCADELQWKEQKNNKQNIGSFNYGQWQRFCLSNNSKSSPNVTASDPKIGEEKKNISYICNIRKCPAYWFLMLHLYGSTWNEQDSCTSYLLSLFRTSCCV